MKKIFPEGLVGPTSILLLASFPGPAQLSVAISTVKRFSVLQATKSWAGPGNEAILPLHTPTQNIGGRVNLKQSRFTGEDVHSFGAQLYEAPRD